MSRAPGSLVAFFVVSVALLLAAAVNGVAVVALSRWAVTLPSAPAASPPEPERLHVPAQAFQSPFAPALPPPVALAPSEPEPASPQVTEADEPRQTPRRSADVEQERSEPSPADTEAALLAWETAPIDLSSADGMRQAFMTGPDGAIWVRRDAFEAFVRDEGLQRAHAPRRVVLVREGDDPVGLRVEGLRSSSAYGLLGLRDGDILRYVNGTHLDSPQRGMAVYGAIQQADTVSLTIRRGGGDRTLVYRVR